MNSLEAFQIAFKESLNDDDLKNERLHIYKNSIYGNKQKALKTIYLVCQKLIGDDCFIKLMNNFLDITPSTSPDLCDIAKNFPHFISSQTILDQVPYLADIAHLERLWHKVFFGKENTTLEIDALQTAIAQHGDNVIFTMPDDAQLISSDFPIDKIWAFCQPEYAGDPEINNINDPVFLILWQQNQKIHIQRVDPDEFILLRSLDKQLSWASVCIALQSNNHPINVEKTILQLCERGLIRFQLPL